MTLSYRETKDLLLDLLWNAVENGNRAEGKPFNPTPEQYEMCCELIKRAKDKIEKYQRMYGLD